VGIPPVTLNDARARRHFTLDLVQSRISFLARIPLRPRVLEVSLDGAQAPAQAELGPTSHRLADTPPPRRRSRSSTVGGQKQFTLRENE
jgi:hypothetical protein